MSSGIGTGVWFFPDGPAAGIVDAVVRAERAGMTEIWLGDEGPAREPFTLLAAAAQVTSTVRLGIGITNPYVRAPALAVTTALTLHELSAGRAMLGVGAGGQMSLGPFHLDAHDPLNRVASFMDTARAVLAGVAGPDYTPDDVALRGSVVERVLPIFIGARREGLNRLASRVADGAFVAGLPPMRFEEVIGWARSERRIDIALYPSVAFDEAAIEHHRPHAIWSLADAPPSVGERLGLDRTAIEAAAAALRAGDPAPATRLIDDAVLSQLMLVGDPETVGVRLAELVHVHEPATIGLALLQDDLVAGVDDAVQAFEVMARNLEEPS